MRIATNTILHTVVDQLMKNQERYLKLEETVATGKRVHTLSSDPPAVPQILRHRTTLASLE